MKNIISYIITILVVFSLGGCTKSSFKDVETLNKSSKQEEIKVDSNIIKENLTNISENIRNYGSDGEIKSSEYIKGKLTSYDYDVKFQTFDVYKQDLNSTLYSDNNINYLKSNIYNSEPLGEGRNIIANNKNFDKNKKTIYLTAHYDTTKDTKGVVDNASGTIAVLELARVLKNLDGDFNIKIVFFSAEEYFRSGSRYFVSNLTEEEKNNIAGCVNVDMVGEKNVGKIVMNSVTGNSNSLSILLDKLTQNKFELRDGGGSDEFSFYMGEIPAVSFWNDYRSGGRSSESAEDDLNSIDVESIKNFCESISKALTELTLDLYNDEIKDGKIIKSKITDNDIKSVGDFQINEKNEILLKNGYDVELEKIYKNKSNDKIVVKERSSRFLPETEFKQLIPFDSVNEDGYILKNTKNKYSIIYKLGFTYGEVSSNLDKKTMIDFFNNYCSSYSDYKIKY